jgi:hypothetical protein
VTFWAKAGASNAAGAQSSNRVRRFMQYSI